MGCRSRFGPERPVLPGILINGYFSIAPDGKAVVFDTTDAKGEPHAWVAPLDRRSPPREVTSSIARTADFGLGDRIYIPMRGKPVLVQR